MKSLEKNTTLVISTIFTLALLVLAIAQETFCYETPWCVKYWDLINSSGPVLFVFVLVLLFSLITFWMKEEVFKKWFKFAVWYIPMLILISLVFGSGGGGGFGAGGAISSSFNWLFIGFFYVIFVITSAIKIAGACDESKKQ